MDSNPPSGPTGSEKPKAAWIQDPFLNQLRTEKEHVHIFLVNGIKLQGTIEAFDQYVVLLKGQSGQGNQPAVIQMVYKHAISTIVPSPKFKFNPEPPAKR